MKPVKIGITGGIGTGKSMICLVLEHLGIPVYHADEESKKLLETNAAVVVAVKNLLGNEAYDHAQKANRSYIASIVFNDREKLQKLNEILHPAVRQNFMEWLLKMDNHKLVAKEAAIMFESGSYKDMDYVVAVSSPDKLRIERVMQRDGKSEAEVQRIIKEQLPQEELQKRSNFVIINDNQHLVLPQVLEIIQSVTKTTR